MTEKVLWNIGVARRSINPAPGVELAGLGYYLQRTWDRVNDDLHATALVITDTRGQSVALVALDVLCADGDMVQAIRSEAVRHTGLRPDAICINCSHSHNAPTMAFFDGAGEIDADYVRQTIGNAAAAISGAWDRRVPASLRVGASMLSGFSYNRTRDNGPVDERVSVLRADTADGRPLAVIVNFHAHPTVFWSVEPRSVSRDWPGDTQPKLEYWTREHCREAAEIVFGAVQNALSSARDIAVPGVNVTERRAQLPTRRWTMDEVRGLYDEGKHRLETGDTTDWVTGIASKMVGFPHRLPERYGGSVERVVGAVSRFAVRWGEDVLPELDTMPLGRTAHFQAMRIGDAWIVANPAEFFTTLSLGIRRRWRQEDLFILGYSNGSINYLPDAFEVGRGSYASQHVAKAIRELPITRDSGMAAVEESLAALHDADDIGLTAAHPESQPAAVHK